jgi:ubiquinone/menaquinone biosynthesis C-methylase UbiE
MHWLPGVHPSPNIQASPETYEIENEAADPSQLLEAAMAAIAPWDGKIVLDLGAGTGFHIPRFHDRARHVIAVEPNDQLRLSALARVTSMGLEHVSVMTGSAEHLLLADRCVDIAHARFAYFFPPNCIPGLAELERVIAPGGTAFIIDNDWEWGTFASWLARSSWCKHVDPVFAAAFWANHGFTLTRIASEWRFKSRTDLEAVVQIEFPPDLAKEILSEHHPLALDYGYCLYSRRY